MAIGNTVACDGRQAESGALIDALLKACDLLSEVFYLVFEILLSAPHTSVAGFEDGL